MQGGAFHAAFFRIKVIFPAGTAAGLLGSVAYRMYSRELGGEEGADRNRLPKLVSRGICWKDTAAVGGLKWVQWCGLSRAEGKGSFTVIQQLQSSG